HEMPELPVLVQVLHLRVLHVRRLEGLAGPERALDRAARAQVTHFDAVEGLPLAGLDELVLDDGERIAIEQDLHPAAYFAGRVAGHGIDRDEPLGGPHRGPRMIAATTPTRQHGAGKANWRMGTPGRPVLES